MKKTKKHVLFTDDVHIREAEIEKAGGRVTQIFEKRILVANFPEQFDMVTGLQYSRPNHYRHWTKNWK